MLDLYENINVLKNDEFTKYIRSYHVDYKQYKPTILRVLCSKYIFENSKICRTYVSLTGSKRLSCKINHHYHDE